MGDTVGPRERALLTQTLVPLLRGLISRNVKVDLRNELRVQGTVVAVDCFMNITMEEARLSAPEGRMSDFSFLFLQSKNIRSVVIPEHLSAPNMLKDQVDIATGVKLREERRKAKEKRANFLRKKALKQMSKPN